MTVAEAVAHLEAIKQAGVGPQSSVEGMYTTGVRVFVEVLPGVPLDEFDDPYVLERGVQLGMQLEPVLADVGFDRHQAYRAVWTDGFLAGHIHGRDGRRPTITGFVTREGSRLELSCNGTDCGWRGTYAAAKGT